MPSKLPICNQCNGPIHLREHRLSCAACQAEYHDRRPCVVRDRTQALQRNHWFCQTCLLIPAIQIIANGPPPQLPERDAGNKIGKCPKCGHDVFESDRYRVCGECDRPWHSRCAGATQQLMDLFKCSHCLTAGAGDTLRDRLPQRLREIVDNCESDEEAAPANRPVSRGHEPAVRAFDPDEGLSAITWTNCAICGSFVLKTEARSSMCCGKQRPAVLTEAQWPIFTREYEDILRLHQDVLHQSSGFMNARLAFAEIHVQRPQAGSDHEGWYYEGAGNFASNLHIGGRTFHQMRRNRFYFTLNDIVDGQRENQRVCLTKLCDYMSRNNPLAMRCRELGYPLDEGIQAPPPQPVVVAFHPDDDPVNQAETFGVGRDGVDVHNMPPIDGVARIRNLFPNQNLEPLLYPMLIPHGKGGYERPHRAANEMQAADDLEPENAAEDNRPMRTLQKFNQRVLYQRGHQLALLARLTEQWSIDSVSRIEDTRAFQMCRVPSVVNAYRRRVASFQELDNALRMGANREHLNRVGTQWNIPASLPNSPHNLRLKIEDGVAVMNRKGDPSVFVTMTMNAKAREFAEIVRILNLPDSHTAYEHPNFTVRIFRAWLSRLRSLLHKKVLGSGLKYYLRVIEFQKRGLIHAHIIARLEDHPVTADQVDKIVSTRLFHADECPNKKTRQDAHCQCEAHQLTRLVSMYMLHSCAKVGFKCCKDRKCKKGFPFDPTEFTHLNQEGMWRYKRSAEDAWVVPYNRRLLLAFKCHLNVLCCSGPGAISYMSKYTNKLPPRVRFRLQQQQHSADAQLALRSELQEWFIGRHLSSSEACARLIQMQFHESEPAVTRLPVHTQNNQLVGFDPVDEERAAAAHRNSRTSLMDWLDRPLELAGELTYVDFFERFEVKESTRVPAPEVMLRNQQEDAERVRYVAERGKDHVARMNRVPMTPRTREEFCLRLILGISRATTWEQLKGGCASHEAYAAQLGLFDQTRESVHCMCDLINREISMFEWDEAMNNNRVVPRACTDTQAVRLFIILVTNGATGSLQLFDTFWAYFVRSPPLTTAVDTPDALGLYQRALEAVAAYLQYSRLQTTDIGLPAVRVRDEGEIVAQERERYPQQRLQRYLEMTHLHDEQHHFVRRVCAHVRAQEPACYHLRGSAGTGKSETLRYILATLRLESFICLPTAFMAATATRLPGGETCHRLFGLPTEGNLEAKREVHSRLKANSQVGLLLRHAALIVIDEISMLHRLYFECIDTVLREVCQQPSEPFGGKVVVVTGDMKQLGPVTKSTDRVTTFESSVVSSHLWQHFTPITLTKQHRSVDEEHTKWLSDVGYGVEDGMCRDGYYEAQLPGFVQRTSNVEQWYRDTIELSNFDAVLLALHNDIVVEHNEAIRQMHASRLQVRPDETKVFYSVTKREKSDAPLAEAAIRFSAVETLQRVQLPSMPAHELRLHVGARTTLLRNLDPMSGLCNGTRCHVTGWTNNLIFVQIIGGEYDGHTRELPRILFKGQLGSSVDFSRKQFPLKLAYCLTINRAQGETWALVPVGLDLRRPVFVHGQLYVALSRVTRSSQLRLLLPEMSNDGHRQPKRMVKNIVFQDLLVKGQDYAHGAEALVRQNVAMFMRPDIQPPHIPDNVDEGEYELQLQYLEDEPQELLGDAYMQDNDAAAFPQDASSLVWDHEHQATADFESTYNMEFYDMDHVDQSQEAVAVQEQQHGRD